MCLCIEASQRDVLGPRSSEVVSEMGRASVRFSLDNQARKGGQGAREEAGEEGDYSCMSSCSLPSSPCPSPEPGRTLRSSLTHYFRTSPGEERGAAGLLGQVRLVFRQLDSQGRGSVARTDFTALCSVLGLSTAPPPPSPSRALHWLPSYSPGRPGTPASPLRVDRLGEVEVLQPVNYTGEEVQYLYTEGPRPFWELWPARRGRGKQLGLQDFTRALLEQWAVTHGLSLELINNNDLVQQSLQEPAGLASRRVAMRSRPLGRRGGRTSLFRRLTGGGAGVRELEQQVLRNQEELAALAETVEHIRTSLHLTDAQNLGLQVLLTQMSKAREVARPTSSLHRRSIERSEAQLERLVAELRGMSQADCLPPIVSTEEVEAPAADWGMTGRTAEARRSAYINVTTGREEEKGGHLNVADRTADKPSSTYPDMLGDCVRPGSHYETGDSEFLDTALLGNRPAEKQKDDVEFKSSGNKMAVSKESIGLIKEYTSEPAVPMPDGMNTVTKDSHNGLLAAELEIQRLRASLLEELRSAKKVLVSSVRSLDALEESTGRESRQSSHLEKLEELLLSPPAASQPGPTSPLSVGVTKPNQSSPLSSGHFSGTPSPGSELLVRLRLEIDQVKEERQRAQLLWSREREALVGQLSRAREAGGQESKGDGVEQKLKSILSVLKSLNTMDISEAVLGRLVLDALEAAYDPSSRQVEVFLFLALLYKSTREYERKTAGEALARALQATDSL